MHQLTQEELEFIRILEDPVEWLKYTTGEIPRWYQEQILRDPSKRTVLRMGRRCMVAGTPVLMADGTWKPIEQIKVGEFVMSRKKKGNFLVRKKVILEHDNGVKDVYRIKLSNGLHIDCTSNHPLLILEPNEDGRGAHYVWKSIEDGLKPGDRSMVIHGFDKWGTYNNPKFGALLGYLLTDDYIIGGSQTPKFTNNNIKMINEVKTICKELYDYDCPVREKGNGYDIHITDGEKGTQNKLNKELKELDLLGRKANNKKLPELHTTWDKETIMACINRMFSGDGGAYTHKNGRNRIATELMLCSTSFEMLEQVRLVLLKIDVTARIDKEARDWKGKESILYRLRIADSLSIENFFENVGFIYGKEERCEEVLKAVRNKAKHRKKGTKNFARITIKSIEYLNEQHTYDIGVKDTHNFIANGIVVHNTGKCISYRSKILTEYGNLDIRHINQFAIQPAIATYNEDTGEISFTTNYSIWENGVKPVYKITTESGRVNYVTGNHPFLTEDGWVDVDSLAIGRKIAVPGSYNKLFVGEHLGEDMARMLGSISAVCGGEVLYAVLNSQKNDIIAFIKSYMKEKGDIKEQYMITNMESVARSIQHLLLRLGVLSTIQTIEEQYRIQILDDDKTKFLNIVNHSYIEPKEQVILYEEIKAIDYIGEEETYDLSVPGTNTFICDDIISHNTWTMCGFMLWLAFTRRDTTIVVATPYENQILVIWEQLLKFIEKSPQLRASVASSTKNPYTIALKNGSKIKGFTAGTKAGNAGGSLRGQKADWIFLDEMDYMSDADFDTIYSIALEAPRRIGVTCASTPTGRRGMFWKLCHDPSWKEFHFPSTVNPEWDASMEDELKRMYSTQIAWDHEVKAEFGDETVGVFKKEFIDRAKANYEYILKPTYDAIRTIGVDWDKYSAETQILVLEFDRANRKFKVILREEIPKSEFTLSEGVNKIIRLNEYFRPAYIYVDRGFGEYQVETLHLYGSEHPETGLKDKVKGISFGESYEVKDPITRTAKLTPIKPFMVNQVVYLLEQDMLMLNENDELIWRQMENYQVVRVSPTGQPIFTSTDEHTIDALMLATLAFQVEMPDLAQIIHQPLLARSIGIEKVNYPDPMRGKFTSHYNNKKAITTWDEPGPPPPQKVPLGYIPQRASTSFARGNSGKGFKRRTW